jgi:hypothetical protein
MSRDTSTTGLGSGRIRSFLSTWTWDTRYAFACGGPVRQLMKTTGRIAQSGDSARSWVGPRCRRQLKLRTMQVLHTLSGRRNSPHRAGARHFRHADGLGGSRCDPSQRPTGDDDLFEQNTRLAIGLISRIIDEFRTRRSLVLLMLWTLAEIDPCRIEGRL